MKNILLISAFIFLLPNYLFSSDILKINDPIESFSLATQFDKKVTINANINKIIISFEKDTGKDINSFLASKEASFLKKHNTLFVANISGMPSIITKLFALPRMRDYKHEILLIYEEENNRFSSKKGFSTLYTLENGIVKSIKYITKDDLEDIFK